MSMQYYLYVDQQYGPYDFNSIQAFAREGRVIPDSWVHADGETKDWTHASDVGSLKALFQPAKPAVAPSPSPSASGLAAKLKQVSDSKAESLGTMLVGPSSSEGVRMMPTVLPNAPLSDIVPDKTGVTRPSRTDSGGDGSEGWFSKFMNLFRRKK